MAGKPNLIAPKDNTKLRRKAKDLALTKLKASIDIIQAKQFNIKHGWVEEDQDFDDYPTQPNPANPWIQLENSSPSSSIRSTSPEMPHESPPESPSSHESSTSEDEERIWDTSPEQYALAPPPPRSLDAWTSTPFTTSSHIPPAFPRDRSDAVVLPPLTRRNAFRLPINNHTFVCTPPTSSRIPLPISPNNVVLDRVNDMSQVLPLNDRSVPRRSTRVSRAPQFLGVPQSQTQWREEE